MVDRCRKLIVQSGWRKLVHAADDANLFAGQILGIVGRKVYRRGGDIVGLTDTPERRTRFHPLAEIAFVESLRLHAFGFDQAGIDGINANLARPKLFC